MNSSNKSKKLNKKTNKAYVDTTTSKVVKNSIDKEPKQDNKAVVEKIEVNNNDGYGSVIIATTLEEFLSDLNALRDRLHDFAIDGGDRTQITQALYEMITGKLIEPIFDENGDEDELVMDWEQFGTYWDEIEETAKNINPEKMKEVIEEFKYDLDGEYTGVSLEEKLMEAINEAISSKTMDAKEVNKWLSDNNFEDIKSKLKEEKGNYNVDDIMKLIPTKELKKLQSDVVTNIDLNENVDTESPESKFNIGDLVYFKPELSGMDKSKGLVIEFKVYEKPDTLFGEKTSFDWYYSFKNSNLRAVESDLTSNLLELKEGVSTDKDLDEEKDGDNNGDEKSSSNSPESSDIKESNDLDNDIDDSETELTSDDENYDEEDELNEDVDILAEFKEMAKNSDTLEDFIKSIRNRNGVSSEVSTAFFNKYGQNGETPEQAAGILYDEVKGYMNENIHQNMKRLIHLNSIKKSADELVSKFGLTDIKKIKESLIEELTDEEYDIVLENVYTTLNIKIENNYKGETESLNESLRSDLHNKLL